MALTDEMGMQGSWLFRWRSYVPIMLLVLMLPPSLLGLHWPFGSYAFHKVWELVCLLISLNFAIGACDSMRDRGICPSRYIRTWDVETECDGA